MTAIRKWLAAWKAWRIFREWYFAVEKWDETIRELRYLR